MSREQDCADLGLKGLKLRKCLEDERYWRLFMNLPQVPIPPRTPSNRYVLGLEQAQARLSSCEACGWWKPCPASCQGKMKCMHPSQTVLVSDKTMRSALNKCPLPIKPEGWEEHRVSALPGISWSYGLTTVTSRKSSLKRTLDSLREAGFPDPWLFVEGDGTPDCSWAEFAPNLTIRSNRTNVASAWILALWEVYLRNPLADRFAIFQDDIVLVRNVRQYLEQCPFPEQGYLNLFSFMAHAEKIVKDASPGTWHLGGFNAPKKNGFPKGQQLGKGAQALVFDRRGLLTLLSSPVFVGRPGDRGGDQKVDAAVVNAMNLLGWMEWIHAPSLVQHVGRDSTIPGKVWTWEPASLSFPGESFDALSFLKKELESSSSK